ncbi:hypothetical protein L3X38_031205 [Prunus dulcis]|uniref:Uncharacterized protein n=1 Tax=Prunus dulcis TaxID=3755 RepID=A0AAD4YVD5_PRUDU|nr:hypothetical protein L3X38_031205 [Prunus dulcis]
MVFWELTGFGVTGTPKLSELEARAIPGWVTHWEVAYRTLAIADLLLSYISCSIGVFIDEKRHLGEFHAILAIGYFFTEKTFIKLFVQGLFLGKE